MLNAWLIYRTVGDKEWFDEDTGDVKVDLRSAVMACEQMFRENQGKTKKHDDIMAEARTNPEALLKKLRGGHT